MIKKNIVWRFFLIIILLFIIVIIIGYAGQSIFFEKFYTISKVNTMKNELSSFANMYKREKWDESKLKNNIASFYKKTNSQLAILDGNRIGFLGNTYEFTI